MYARGSHAVRANSLELNLLIERASASKVGEYGSVLDDMKMHEVWAIALELVDEAAER